MKTGLKMSISYYYKTSGVTQDLVLEAVLLTVCMTL